MVINPFNHVEAEQNMKTMPGYGLISLGYLLLTLATFILLAGLIPGALADPALINQNMIEHGDEVTVSYDLSQYTYHHAVLCPVAYYYDTSNTGRYIVGRYDYSEILLAGKQGDVVFGDTNLGDFIFFEIYLRDENDEFIDYLYIGEVNFTDSWIRPSEPTLSVTPHQTAVPAGTPISADYIISYTGNCTRCEVGWNVFSNTENEARARNYDGNMPTSGTVELHAPSLNTTHYVCAYLNVDDWYFEVENRTDGIMVTTDGTSEPLSIDLTFTDRNGNTLDPNHLSIAQGQLVMMSWQMRGGYSAYEGYLSLSPKQGQTNIGHMGYARAAGKVSFMMQDPNMLVLTLEYHDDHGNSGNMDISIEAAPVTPVLVGDYPWISGNPDTIDFPVYIGLPLMGDAGVFQWGDIIKVSVHNYSEMALRYGGEPSWQVIRTDSNPGSLNYSWETEYSGGRKGRAYGKLESIPTTPMEAELLIECSWGGQTAGKTVQIHVVQPGFQFPVGLENLPDTIDTQVGQTLTLAPTLAPAGWNGNGCSSTVFAANGLSKFAKWTKHGSIAEYDILKAGTFNDTVGLQTGTIMVVKPVVFRVKDTNGNLPSTDLDLVIDRAEQNVYIGLENYDVGTGTDRAGVWAEPANAHVRFSNYENLKNVFGGMPVWSITRQDNVDINIGMWHEDHKGDEGFLEFVLEDIPDQPEDVVYNINCEWGDQRKSIQWIVHYTQLNTVPTGHDYPALLDNIQVGDTLSIEPQAEPAGFNISGYPFRTCLFAEQMDSFAVLDETASTDTKKVYTITKAGVYNAMVLLGVDTITIGQETIFRIAGQDGSIPRPEPKIGSQNGFERNIYLVPGCTPGEEAYGRLTSSDFLFQPYVENESVCAHELQGEPVWTITENGSAPEHVGIRSDGRKATLYLKTMPASLEDHTYEISCTWDGQTGRESYTVHFLNAPKGLPRGVWYQPKDHMLITTIGYPPAAEVFFENWDQIDGEDEWFDYSDNIADALGWHGGSPKTGVYKGYMETGCANLIWRERLTLVLTELDGTMDRNDYVPFGTVTQMPDGLTTIESEAFRGTQLTEIDIPAGVSIANDAFDDTGLIAIYTHNDQDTINWAVNHGIVALTE